jgi:hypothetical protein
VSDLLARPMTAADEPAVLALHNRAFGPPLWDARWLAWRLHHVAPEPLGSPGGAFFIGFFDAAGACHAVYGGVRHRLLLDGQESLVMSHCDMAVAPEHRTGLGGSRMVAELMRRFYDSQGGGATELMYGTPEPPLRRMAVWQRRSEVLCDLVFLAHELRSIPPSPAGISVRTVPAVGPDADQLWERCAPEYGAATVRDARYLNTRFADHPGVAYELSEARGAAGELRGVLVMRQGGWTEGIATLADWLVPRADGDAERALLAHAVTYARARGRRALVAWFPAPEPRFLRFQTEHGFLAHPSPYQFVFRAYRPGLDRRWLHERWYLTMGDIDFF